MADKAGIAIGTWFIGADIALRFTVYTDTTHTACVDVSTYTMSYVLRKGNRDADPALIEKTSGSGISITGVFNSVPDTNTQRVIVSIAADDTLDLRPGEYQHALKRTDTGNETVLAYTDADTPAVLTKAAL